MKQIQLCNEHPSDLDHPEHLFEIQLCNEHPSDLDHPEHLFERFTFAVLSSVVARTDKLYQ